jgi:four helix bundle protein
MTPGELRERTARLAQQVRRFCLPRLHDLATRDAARQLMRASASVAANYRAACFARSRAEFVARLGLVLGEADETLHWIRYLTADGVPADLDAILTEARQLAAIFGASYRTARRSSAKSSKSSRSSKCPSRP